MRIEVCVNKGLKEARYAIDLTKKDIEERTWSKHETVELTRTVKDLEFECYEWKSSEHSEDDVVISHTNGDYAYILVIERDGDGRIKTRLAISYEEFSELVKKLEADAEWLETIESLKHFMQELLKKSLVVQ